ALPIYHFLCDIQNQENRGIGFSWGSIQYDFDFLPRLIYNDVVLSRATWHISHNDIKEITSQDDSKLVEVVRNYVQKRKIPTIVSFVQGDNEVIINFDNELSCYVFFNMLKGERFVQLQEFLFKEDGITQNYC